jgi:uncharacterized protein YbjT (DUF2867 family)
VIVKIAIAGGHGKIALRMTSLLSERGDSILSLIRKAEHEEDIRQAGGDPVMCNLETVSNDELAGAIGSVDAVVFAAGAGPGSGPERKETVDYGGAAKLIDAAQATGIDRYLIISSTGANANVKGDDTFAVYLRAKGRADKRLIESGLAYTVVRPTGLTDDPGDGRVSIAERVPRGRIPRDDVAAVVVACLDEEAAIGKTFEVTDGDVPAAEAVRAL